MFNNSLFKASLACVSGFTAHQLVALRNELSQDDRCCDSYFGLSSSMESLQGVKRKDFFRKSTDRSSLHGEVYCSVDDMKGTFHPQTRFSFKIDSQSPFPNSPPNKYTVTKINLKNNYSNSLYQDDQRSTASHQLNLTAVRTQKEAVNSLFNVTRDIEREFLSGMDPNAALHFDLNTEELEKHLNLPNNAFPELDVLEDMSSESVSDREKVLDSIDLSAVVPGIVKTAVGEDTLPHYLSEANGSSIVPDVMPRTSISNGEKHHDCGVCGKVFAKWKFLSRHKRTHMEKNQKCIVCLKAFVEPNELVRHARTHTGEKPYTCLVCGNGFTVSGSLTRHARIHTGEKLHTCNVCDKAFARLDSFAVHTRRSHMEKQCKICYKVFTESSGLTRHKKTHMKRKKKL